MVVKSDVFSRSSSTQCSEVGREAPELDLPWAPNSPLPAFIGWGQFRGCGCVSTRLPISLMRGTTRDRCGIS
jgi:hypothetical protein